MGKSAKDIGGVFWRAGKPLFILFVLMILYCQDNAMAEEINCIPCHKSLTENKVIHVAVQMGCATCHSAIDAKETPHKKTGKTDKGLSSGQPDLCYNCHDRTRFAGKNVHAALGMGCTVCHNPHSSKNQKLLVSEQPDICFNCHDKAKFSGRYTHAPAGIGMCSSCHSPHQSANEKLLISKPPELCYSCHEKAEFSKRNIHKPVADGKCLHCHSPHASENNNILIKEPLDVCLECHPDVKKQPHAVAGLSSAGHSIGILKKGQKTIDDPARPGKRFYCGSCHNPHSSDWMRLFRYQANSTFDTCRYCHIK